MLRLVRRLKSYDERGRFDQWLFRIAANLARDRIRRLKATPSIVSLSAEQQDRTPLAERLAGRERPVERRLEAEEASRRLAEALDKLDDTTRQMILLRHMGRMSFKELAELYGCPLGTALARVHRGLRALRRYMGAQDATE